MAFFPSRADEVRIRSTAIARKISHPTNLSAAEASRAHTISTPTAAKALTTLESYSIAREITGQQHRMLYTCREYLNILNEDTI